MCNSMYWGHSTNLSMILSKPPRALALINGSNDYPEINGTVKFYRTNCGVLVYSEVYGLPDKSRCGNGVFAFHIHGGKSCTGNVDDPFANALTHYDKYGNEHPYHSGDMPPLFSNKGYALSAFLTNRFTLDEITGKSVIIHSGVDDFTSQPAGNAGSKIACGVIARCC